MRIRDRSRAGPLKFYDFVHFSGIKIPGPRKNQEIERTSLRFAAHLLVVADASRPRQRGGGLQSAWLLGAKRRTTTRIKPTPGGKACGFPARRGLSAAPLVRQAKLDVSNRAEVLNTPIPNLPENSLWISSRPGGE